jgi:hypothetical protein
MMESKSTSAVKQYNKTYYTTNKAKLLEDARQKVLCETCQCQTSKSNLTKHRNSAKHILNAKIKELQK